MTVQLYRKDCLKVLPRLPDAGVDALVTDPPYSSGGCFRSDRMGQVADKYLRSQCRRFAGHDFSGDNRDQRSWKYWCQLWLSECLRAVRPGGYAIVFTDWRQLPTLTDALQAAGWVWRGIIPWNKGRSARAPHTGYFRHQCEYAVWGTRGRLGKATHGGPWDGCYDRPVLQRDKHHVTGKPTALMIDLLRCLPTPSTVLDPFMGSGTTGVACAELGHHFIGIEQDAGYVALARERIAEVGRGRHR